MAQFSVTLELTRLATTAPVRRAASYAYEHVDKLIRQWRGSGSDLLVEDGLAAVFGRMRIDPSLEQEFRDTVKVNSFIQLHPDHEVVLRSGPGPTVARGLKGSYYLSTIIQLSFLGWFVERDSLASGLVECMRRRSEAGVKEASRSLDYDGVVGALHACSSQTSAFSWNRYLDLVRSETSLPHLKASLRPEVLLGLMDYLFAVQTLPKDRIIVVEDSSSFLPIIVWAHYILGLSVVAHDFPNGAIRWGAGQPSVIINHATPQSLEPSTNIENLSSVSLLDSDLNIVLQESSEARFMTPLACNERIPLKGYGSRFLFRQLNATSIVHGDDPALSDSANIATALAVFLSMQSSSGEGAAGFRDHFFSIEVWHIMEASEILFDGCRIDSHMVEYYRAKLHRGCQWSDAWEILLSNSKHGLSKNHGDVADWLLEPAVVMILCFAHVTDIAGCASVHFGYENVPREGIDFYLREDDNQTLSDGASKLPSWFDMVSRMMDSANLGSGSLSACESACLLSDFGWSIFTNSMSRCDPAEPSSRLLSIKRGVPVSTANGEAKRLIQDSTLLVDRIDTNQAPGNALEVNTLNEYVCPIRVCARKTFYSDRRQAFWVVNQDTVTEHETSERGELVSSECRMFFGPRQMFDCLYKVKSTLPCCHREESPRSGDQWPLTFSRNISVLTKISRYFSPKQGVVVAMTNGDANARWAAVTSLVSKHQNRNCSILLRTKDCCIQCAIGSAMQTELPCILVL